jgi:sulfofructose kinase
MDFSRCRPQTILFDGHEPLISLPLAQWAKERALVTVLDAGSVRLGTRELAPRVDYLVASMKFAREFTGEKHPERALTRLSRVSPCVVITLGEHGLVWQRGKETGKLPAFSVRATDTTGAGDAFHGAFAWALASGHAAPECARIAAAVSALKCRRLGARSGLPTQDELKSFLAAQP